MNLRILKTVSGLMIAIAIQFRFGTMAFAATTNVTTSGFTFSPPGVTINVGDSVTWSGLGNGLHNVQTDTDPFCGPPSPSLSTCTITFNQPGTYNYYCSPHRAFGMTGTVTVQAAANTPPSVTITNPANGAVFAAPANVTIQANASDADGNVTNVQFFLNAGSVGADTTSPYSIIASNLAAGSYSLRAVAADNGGLSSTSAAVTISVVTSAVVTLSSTIVTNGQFQFNYTANPGLRYVVENSSNLVNWTGAVTNTASSNNVKFGETLDGNFLRFYRVGRLPNP